MSNTEAVIALGLLMIDLKIFNGFFTKVALTLVVVVFILGYIN